MISFVVGVVVFIVPVFGGLKKSKEGARLGFERCIIPKQSFSSLSKAENYGIQIIGVRTLEQAFRAINANKEETK